MKLANKSQNKEVLQELKLAKGIIEKSVGLLGKKSLPIEEGLLFERCSSIHTIGMRFSIDVAFINSRGVVLKIRLKVPPLRLVFGPVGTYYTLEASAGALSQVEKGDILQWQEL